MSDRSATGPDPAFDRVLRGHYVEHLGLPETSVQLGDEAYAIDEFEDVPGDGCWTLATRGLSATPTHGGRHPLDQELVLPVDARWRTDDLLRLLGVIADQVVARDEPMVYGEAFGPAGPIAPGASTEGFAVIPAIYFDPGLDAAAREGGEILVMMLAPVHAEEIAWLEEHGVERFVDELKEQEVDLIDLARAPMTLV
jgi:hypothetical protein